MSSYSYNLTAGGSIVVPGDSTPSAIQLTGWPLTGNSSKILANSSVRVPFTGSTSETVLATVRVPSGIMRANGVLNITALWSMTNSGNNKTPRVRFGGPSGFIFYGSAITTSVALQTMLAIRNRNAQNAQVGMPINMSTTYGTSTSALTTASIDTTIDQDIAFTAQLASAADSLNLESYLVEVFPA